MQSETKKLFSECRLARKKISHRLGIRVGAVECTEQGLYIINYANCLLNRQADIYDDTMLLIDNNRIQAACVISRGMIETYAFAKFLSKRVAAILANNSGEEGVQKALKLVISFTNSSRFKEADQKKLDKGVFVLDDYSFTEQAKHRFENSLASSEHVMDALRDLYKEETLHTKQKESGFEVLYDALSEWVHPSQTSVFHNYTPDTHKIPTSIGPIHLYDNAKYLCANALHFITDSMNIYNWTMELANEITRRGNE